MSRKLLIEKGGDGGDGGESWKWGQTHHRRMCDLLKSGFGSDLTLLVGPEQSKVPVHKVFLKAGSRVLNSSINKCSGTQLVVENVDTRIFGLMLKYLYTGNSESSMGDALPLLQIATDFEVDELRDQCAALLQSDITLENVLPLFQGAMEYAHKKLIQNTLKYICRQGQQIVKRKEFENLRLECLIEIIQQDGLRVTNEMAVFEAVYRWGEAECVRKAVDGTNAPKLRKVLDKPLKYIRFPLMDKEEFAMKVGTKNILDMSELTTLLMCFLVSPERRNVLPVGRFSSTSRNYLGARIVYSRWHLGDSAARVAQKQSHYPRNQLTEAIMICWEGEDNIMLRSLSIWKSIFNVEVSNQSFSYNGIGSIVAKLKLNCGQQTVFEVKNQALIENDEVLELKLDKGFAISRNQGWVELDLTISGTVEVSSQNYGYAHGSKQSTNLKYCNAVSNYGDFLDEEASKANIPTVAGPRSLLCRTRRFPNESVSLVNCPGVRFTRPDGDTTPMSMGLIEKLTFETV